MANVLTAKKEENIAEWYQQVCLKAELAEYATVKGCMVLRPNGYAIWDSIQKYFDENINKATGVRNAYFPLFIPESFFNREKEHAKGLKIEVAWLDKDVTGDGERLAVRPTSETIMYDSYSRWIRSYRDLPLKMNQWCNVVRWETEATKLFLRSREFLWQEGHCVYETKSECEKETLNYIQLYTKLCKELLALPVLTGKKTEKEKFAGADYTMTIESFMPDGKALQCGTSHLLSQNFAKAFNIKYLGKDEKEHTPFQNSWGLSTRLIGASVMTHSDNKGLVLPPRVAENKAIIIPVFIGDSKDKVAKKAKEIAHSLKEFNVILDDREEYNPGWKFTEWELKGIPLRIELGPKDLEKDQVVIVRRDTGVKTFVPLKDLKRKIEFELEAMHNDLYQKAEKFLKSSLAEAKDWKEFVKLTANKLVKVPFCGEKDCEDDIKAKTEGVTSRVIPFDDAVKKGSKCIHCGKEAKVNVYFSRAY
ncbi:proline--tRNA ligase [Candidatus Woesearchaeota archaeon]|nr:proline--tRNA ligase [Candidatus Woesearchaeota archaeon]